MSTVSHPADPAPPLIRHGKTRAYVVINHYVYRTIKIRRDHYRLQVVGGERDGESYQAGRTRTGHYCTCPDHLHRQVRCKHVGALCALGLMSWPRRKGVARG